MERTKTRILRILSAKTKRAFTLFELIIVVLIIGIVYALMIQNFAFAGGKEQTNLSLENLSEGLKKNYAKSDEKVSLKCFDECSVCKVYVGTKEQASMDSFFDKFSNPQVYTLKANQLERLEFAGFSKEYKNYEVCFEYNIYPNKSSDKIILVYKDKAYLYDNFLGKTQVFANEQEAMDKWLRDKDEAKED